MTYFPISSPDVLFLVSFHRSGIHSQPTNRELSVLYKSIIKNEILLLPVSQTERIAKIFKEQFNYNIKDA
jgi:hypothetical protein